MSMWQGTQQDTAQHEAGHRLPRKGDNAYERDFQSDDHQTEKEGEPQGPPCPYSMPAFSACFIHRKRALVETTASRPSLPMAR